VSIPVSTATDEWIAAEVLRDEFTHEQSLLDAEETPADEDKAEATVDLAARFLGFVSGRVHDDPQSIHARTSLLLNVFKHFTLSYLSEKDVHSLVAQYDKDVRKAVLSSYIQALAVLQSQKVTDIPTGPQSALLSDATSGVASIFAIFGGQGTNEVYFDELQSLYDIYKPFVAPFIATVTKDVLIPLAAKQQSTSYFTYGLDVISWLSGASPRPPLAYLATVPVSFPVIGLTQLVQYLVTARVAGLTPGELRERISGTTGHSQGIVSAVAIAASTTFESFTENVRKALKWLFFSGLRGQQAFPVVSLDPSIIQDSIDGGEGTPSPMLSVTGLVLKNLEPYVKKTNAHLPENSKLHVSLHNGPRAFVVTGPSRALYGLVTALRKVRAASGLDQSKIPFSQRKPVFSVRFLVVGVPYHNREYLEGETEKVLTEDLGGEELWKAEDLLIPVYNTEDGVLFSRYRFITDEDTQFPFLGSDLRSLSSSITRSLCDQIFTKPIHWSAATNFPATATHAIDFGPGGLSGIGLLTSRNLDGRGVRVIVIGERGKGDAELYDAQKVNYEEWWSKKWGPALIRTRSVSFIFYSLLFTHSMSLAAME
jgi:fatty acid synthase subunit alpha